MRIVVQDSVGGPEVLSVVSRDEPTPGPGEVLIHVGGAGVNPVDAAVRGGHWPILGDPPYTVGWDVAGTVAALGPGVTVFAVGDRVFGMPHFPKSAAGYASSVVAPASEVTRTPAGLSDVEAAALPLAGLTAWQALVETADVQPGQRVLLPAAGGGVGHLAVQIAKARGAHVTALVSPAKVDFARSLGADDVIDYTSGSAPDGFDVVMDPFGASHVIAARRGGVVVALLDADDADRAAAAARGVRLERILVRPHGAHLAALASLVEAGHLRPHVSGTFPLAKVADAHHALAEGHLTGKLVLVP